MIDFKKYNLRIEDLKLIKLDFNFKTSEAGNMIYEVTNRTEQENIELITKTYPTISSLNNDEDYWDIVLVDSELLFYLENILVKYGIIYTLSDITNQYYPKPKKLNKDFVNDINKYVDKFLELDQILDKISSEGLSNLNKFELSFLERQSKNLKNE